MTPSVTFNTEIMVWGARNSFNYKQQKSKNIVSSLWEKNLIKIDSEQKKNSY